MTTAKWRRRSTSGFTLSIYPAAARFNEKECFLQVWGAHP
jgi:hypothetical protein